MLVEIWSEGAIALGPRSRTQPLQLVLVLVLVLILGSTCQVPVWVLNEAEALHSSSVRALVDRDAERLEALERRVDVRHRHPDVPEASFDRSLSVRGTYVVRVPSVEDALLFGALAPVVPRELDAPRRAHQHLPLRRVVRLWERPDPLRKRRHEVHREAPLREVFVPDQAHAESGVVEL